MKSCTKCGEEKPVSMFSKRARSHDGLQSRCKSCCSEESAIYGAKNRDKRNAASARYYAKNRSKAIAATVKWASKNPDNIKAALRKWRAKNKKQISASNAKWRVANLDKRKADIAKWRAENPLPQREHRQNRRARKSGGKLSNGLIERLIKLQRGLCPCCQKKLGNDYHIDHIMPLALGGKNEDSNIQLLRAKCNLQKNAKHPVDFMQLRGFLL